MRTLFATHIIGLLGSTMALVSGLISPHHIFILSGIVLFYGNLLLLRNTLRMRAANR